MFCYQLSNRTVTLMLICKQNEKIDRRIRFVVDEMSYDALKWPHAEPFQKRFLET